MAQIEVTNLAALKQMKGEKLPLGTWFEITQEMINDFAKATQDFQWLHVDIEKTKTDSPFKKPIAHGFMSVALLSKLLTDLVEVKSSHMGINYGLNKVRFPSPVLVNSQVRLNATIRNTENYGEKGLKVTWGCTIEIKGQDKPACVAEFLGLLFEP